MKKIDIIEPYLNISLSSDKYRQMIIDKVTAKLILEEYTEKEALSMFLWKLSDIEPSVSYEEQQVFCGIYRMFHSYFNISIESKEQAFEVLNISKNKLNLPVRELIKEVKLTYWKQFNNLTQSISNFLLNAREIGIKKKAFNFLCNDCNVNF